jgi:hypothetical protein
MTAVDLEQRRQQLAPEALVGDEAAVAELARIDTELAELRRRDELEQLASDETARRQRIAEEKAAAARRAEQAREKGKLEAKRDEELGRVEKHLAALVAALDAAFLLDEQAGIIADVLGERHPRLKSAVETRLSWQLRQSGIHLPPPYGMHGSESLVTPDCVVCRHPEREAIEAVRANSTLRSLEERFAVSKSALSRHFNGH